MKVLQHRSRRLLETAPPQQAPEASVPPLHLVL
jgi:hypothetical protein